jgi:hypothetical protein
VSHPINVSFPSTKPPLSVFHSLLQQTTNHSQTLNSMPFTLTHTHAVPTLQLLQQPICHQHKRLGLYVSTRWIENLNKNKSRSFTVLMWRQGKGGGTNPLITHFANMWSWAVNFMLCPSYRWYILTGTICVLQCRSVLLVIEEEVILLSLLVFNSTTPIMQSSHPTHIAINNYESSVTISTEFRRQTSLT